MSETKQYKSSLFVVRFENKVHIEAQRKYIDVVKEVCYTKEEFLLYFACDTDGKRRFKTDGSGKKTMIDQPISASVPFDDYKIIQNPYILEAEAEAKAKAKK